MTNYNGFYEWADVDLVPGLYQGDTTPIPMSFLIGGVRLRQLRVREGITVLSIAFFYFYFFYLKTLDTIGNIVEASLLTWCISTYA